MKKSGFTLAELVVTLGVIGIITALIVPAAHKLMPDNNKVLYLKAYDTISTTIDGLKNNSKLYPICSKDNIDCASHPLFSNRKPLLAPFNESSDDRFEGKTKLCNLLAFSFDDLNNANCKSDRYTYDDSTFGNNVSFVSKNGMQWIVSPYEYSYDSSSARFQTDIWVDINGSAEPNCIYSAACQKPDRFKFMVAADGTIVQADPKGIAYTNTRKTFTKNKADETINSTVIASTLDSTLASFTYRACGGVEEDPKKNTGMPPGLKCTVTGDTAPVMKFKFYFDDTSSLYSEQSTDILLQYRAKSERTSDVNNFSWEDYDKKYSGSTYDYRHAYSQYSIPSGSLTGSQSISQELRCNYYQDSVLFKPAVIIPGGHSVDVTNSVQTKPELKESTISCYDLYNKCR